MFSIEANIIKDDLKNSSISNELSVRFKNEGFSISKTAILNEKDDGLMITDGEKIYNLKNDKNDKNDKKVDEWINIYREDTQDKAWCYHDLGYLLYQTWDYDEAVKKYTGAIEIAKKAKDEKSIAWFFSS